MDNGTGTIDQTADSSGVATETAQGGGSASSEQVASETLQGEQSIAGGERSSSEGGREQGTEERRPRFKSKNETIYELRQAIRERDAKFSDLESRLSSFEQKFKSGPQERKPSRTFWEAPEEVLDERITGHLSEMEKRILDRMEQRDTQTKETTEWKQETSEAAKFIRAQKGLTEDDITELSSMISEHPTMDRLRPMERAEYAMFLFNKNRGVTDKTALKQRAAGVQGASAQQQGGPRMWTESEMEQEVAKLGDPKTWDTAKKSKYKEMEQEFLKAYAEKRVKK